MTPRWWPYQLPVDEVLKKSAVLLAGVVSGNIFMNKVYSPMENLYDRFEQGQIQLFTLYTQIYEERRIRDLEERSDAASASLKKI